MQIDLVKPIQGSDGPRAVHDGEYFDRGERIILVDGERWGRTIVSSHGPHGQRHRFRQQGDLGTIKQAPEGSTNYKTDAAVWSAKSANRGRSSLASPVAPLEERIIEKVRELIEAGLLRNPAQVATEQAAAASLRRAERAETKRLEDAAFHARACAALGVSINDHGEKVQAVIAAMRWAQSQ